MIWSAIGAFCLSLAVAAGALGAHALRGRLDEYALSVYDRAVFYQFIHAAGLLIVPLFARMNALSRRGSQLVCILLLAGIVLFCGSLYVLALTGSRIFGVVTPFGGIAFIAAWALLGFELIRRR